MQLKEVQKYKSKFIKLKKKIVKEKLRKCEIILYELCMMFGYLKRVIKLIIERLCKFFNLMVLIKFFYKSGEQW